VKLERMKKDAKIRILAGAVAFSILILLLNGITTGLDLQGGSKITVQTEGPMDALSMDQLITVMTERLNVYGIKDVRIRPWGDLADNESDFVLVEIAGVNTSEAIELLGKPGKVDVRIGNRTIYGGADIEVEMFGYNAYGGGWSVPFAFKNDYAAKSFADAVKEVYEENGSVYIDTYLDGKAVSEGVGISPSLQEEINAGSIPKRLQITMGGSSDDPEARDEAKRLHSYLRSGVLTSEVSIVGSSQISPTLAEGFGRDAVRAGFLALAAVSLFIYARYRNPLIVLPIMATGISEVIIILGVASLIRWNIDLPAIAGIIAAVGTGVDDQIVITDEVLMEKVRSIGFRIKSAFFIIMAAWATTVAAMLPLVWLGQGMLVGFAITTIIGVTVGVFITRPAYARTVQYLLKD